MQEILFICTGNYYRSRFCELFFNHLVADSDLAFRAFSRGLRVLETKTINSGPISRHTINYLSHLRIEPQEDFRYPIQMEEEDLLKASMIIALDKEEHYPMVQDQYPDWLERIDFWSFPDDYIVQADQVLPRMEERVRDLIISL
ncbi:MAG: hypothetical protein KDC44_03945 [Phaeodactylibacter sp.]|nr:hypothetical protein [Phaeodactylibacter sp.]